MDSLTFILGMMHGLNFQYHTIFSPSKMKYIYIKKKKLKSNKIQSDELAPSFHTGLLHIVKKTTTNDDN